MILSDGYVAAARQSRVRNKSRDEEEKVKVDKSLEKNVFWTLPIKEKAAAAESLYIEKVTQIGLGHFQTNKVLENSIRDVHEINIPAKG